MKKLMGLLLVMLGAILVMGIGNIFHSPQSLPIAENHSVEKPQQSPPELPQVNNDAPKVSAEELFAHIQKLNFRRYTKMERSRTRSYITSELKKARFFIRFFFNFQNESIFLKK